MAQTLYSSYGFPGLTLLTPTITAHAGGGQGSAVALTAMINRISVCATAGDSVRLPASAVGLVVVIENRGAAAARVFGAGTETINGIATATGISQGVNTTATYVCSVLGNWEVPLTQLVSTAPVVISADAAISPRVAQTYVVTKAGVALLTLAAPTTVVDDGLILRIVSTTANAHTLTATGLIADGSTTTDVATFAANAGAGLTLMAYAAKWYLISSVGITFS